MAAGAGVTLDTQIVRKEDVLNLIRLLDMKKTPFIDRVNKGHAPWNRVNSWTVDGYAAPNTDGVPEGQDVDSFDDTAANRAELEVYIQQWRRPWMVSQFAEKMSVYGLSQGEAAEAVRKSLVHITRDMEVTFLSDNETTKTGGKKSNELRTRGLGKWIQTGAQSTFPVPKEYRPLANQIVGKSNGAAGVNEEDLRKMLTSIFDSLGYSNEDLILLCGSTLRRRITSMTIHDGEGGNQLRRLDVTGRRVTDTIETYVSDFNATSVIPSNFIGWDNVNKRPDKDRGYLLDFAQLEAGFLDYKISKELEDRGGGRRGFVDAFGVLRVISPLPHGKFYKSA